MLSYYMFTMYLKHSTWFAVLELNDRVNAGMGKMKTPINIFLDLSEAFNTLNHKILLGKSKYYCSKGVAYNLMEIYI